MDKDETALVVLAVDTRQSDRSELTNLLDDWELLNLTIGGFIVRPVCNRSTVGNPPIFDGVQP
jgi:hypothetical protein